MPLDQHLEQEFTRLSEAPPDFGDLAEGILEAAAREKEDDAWLEFEDMQRDR